MLLDGNLGSLLSLLRKRIGHGLPVQARNVYLAIKDGKFVVGVCVFEVDVWSVYRFGHPACTQSYDATILLIWCDSISDYYLPFRMDWHAILRY